MSILEAIKKNRPNLTAGSLRTYMSNIKKTGKDIGLTLEKPSDLITNHEAIMAHLMTMKPTIRKTKISGFIVALDEKEKSSDEVKDILVIYRKQLVIDGDEASKEEHKQKLTKRQEEAYISWEEVLKVYSGLKLESENLFKLDYLTKKQFYRLQDFVLLSLYVLTPPRRSMDYTTFKIAGDIDKTTDNYMEINGKKKEAFFHFNNYKNATRLGKQVVPVDNALRNIIQKWMLKNPHEYLLVNTAGKQLDISRLNVLLNNIFKKAIGSSMLRHIFITEKYGDVDLQDLADTTEAMGNSEIERTLKYVNKKGAKKQLPENPDD